MTDTQNHLRPIPESDGSSASGGKNKQRAPTRPRPSKALPTDRLKWGQQVNALKAIAVASNYGKEAVGATDIAPRLGIIPATAGLSNQFFMESGLIVREAKGRYKPTEAVNRFVRKHGFDPAGAGLELAGTLSRTWYFQAVRQQLQMGPTTWDSMIRVLADTAGATAEYETQLGFVLSWLEFAGLITTESGMIRVTETAAEEVGDAAPDGQPTEDTPTPPADPSSEGTPLANRRREPPKAEPVLSFSFDFELTAEDLEDLSPEQIQAAFKAVGEVMAMKAAIKT